MNGFRLLIYDRMRFGDFTVTTRFQMVEGVVAQMAGLVFRYQDPNNFYAIRASALGQNVRFYKVVGGIRSNPIGPTIPVRRGVWYELEITCQGNKIRAKLNGRDVLPELTDTSFAVGKIGFLTKSDAVSHFADLRISYTPREALAEVLVRDAPKNIPACWASNCISPMKPAATHCGEQRSRGNRHGRRRFRARDH
jgi:hypothetical protein